MNSPNWISFRLELDEITWIREVQQLLKKHKGLDLSLSKTCRYLIRRGGEAECRALERLIDKPVPRPTEPPAPPTTEQQTEDKEKPA